MNSYKSVLMPNHPRAWKNGRVPEHIIVAEQKLGRPIKVNEVVHHIDGDKANNSPENLIVFRSDSDHNTYHMGGVEPHQVDDYWVCERKLTIKTCQHCGKQFQVLQHRNKTRTRYCSMKCYRLSERKSQYDTKTLVDEVMESKGNFSEVGRRHGVSSNAIAKRLKAAGLPYHSCDYRKQHNDAG